MLSIQLLAIPNTQPIAIERSAHRRNVTQVTSGSNALDFEPCKSTDVPVDDFRQLCCAAGLGQKLRSERLGLQKFFAFK
jgi:hypothetical protein